MKGRKIGQTEVSVDEIQTIVRMTEEGCDRSEIAKEIRRSKKTVYLYQKRFYGS